MKTLLASIISLLAATAAQAAVLSFDDLNTVYGYGVPGPHMTLTERSLSYTEDGYTMTLWAPNAEPDKVHIGDTFFDASFNWHDGGDNALGSYVTLRRNDGAAFDLNSFSYGDSAMGFTVRAAGYADQFLTGFSSFETPYLDVTEVVFVGILNYSYLDNLVVSGPETGVPEPGSAALLLGGLVLLDVARRRPETRRPGHVLMQGRRVES